VNKAVTREAEADDDDLPGFQPMLAGPRSYITPAGFKGLHGELMTLLDARDGPETLEVIQVRYPGPETG
jgi:hypothetical protein